MAAPAGFAGQFGLKTETTWGTGVTVDTFYEIQKESLKNDIPRFASKGIRAGRRVTFRWAAGVSKVGGQVVLELPNLGIAKLMNHMFGTVPAATGVGPYTYTGIAPGPLLAKSFTAQVGRPDIAGTVDPFTYAGCKINSWELSSKINEYVQLILDVVAKSETTATSLASASYGGTYSPFTFVQAALTVAGGSIAVNDFTLKAGPVLKVDRSGPGSATVREQLEHSMRDFTGTINADFEALTAYNRFVNATESALVLTFSNGTDTLTITCNVRYDGETPAIEDMGILKQALPFVCVSGTSDAAAISAVLVCGDATV